MGFRKEPPDSRWILSLIVITILLFFGCAPETRREVVTPHPQYVPPPPIPVAMVEERISHLSALLENEKTPDADRQVAKELLTSYGIIKTTLEPPTSEGDRQKVIRVLFQALTDLEKDYFGRERLDDSSYAKVIGIYAQKKMGITKAFLAGAHESVVHEMASLQELFGKEALTSDMRLLLSLSLAKRGRLQEAIQVGEEVLKEIEGRPDEISLRALILEWQLGEGQTERAQESFMRLVRSAGEREALLREAAQRMASVERAAPQETPVSPTLSETESAPATAEIPTLQKLLDDVAELIKQNEFTKAKFILLQQRIRFMEGPETEAIDQAMTKVEEAERRMHEGVEAVQEPSPLDEDLKTVRKMIEEENYDQALARIEDIESRRDIVNPEVELLRQSAVDKLINRERNKAAKLYLMAKSTSDRTKKAELLLASYDILKSILDKYPSSPLNKKINENMTRIKEEMDTLKKNPS